MTDTNRSTTTSTAATLTLERFAALEPAWFHHVLDGDGVLLARIHPRNNRLHGDETVLARALVFVPPCTYPAGLCEKEVRAEGHLARLTIRTTDLTDLFPKEHAELLRTVLSLPVIELEAQA